jgi:4-amino-4-deoxy-L-arabinose transferase-like glycosyltransferase
MIRRFPVPRGATGNSTVAWLSNPLIFWTIAILVSAAFRLWSLELLNGRVPDGDAPYYLALAHNILSGRGLAVDYADAMHNMRATYPPLYPMVLAGVGLILPLSFAVIAAVNTAFDFACAWLMTRLGKDLGEEQAGSLAAALYLVWPTNLGMAAIARKEPLIALLVMALLVVLVRATKRGQWHHAALYGVLTGLLALTQPGLLFLPVLFALVVLPCFPDWRRWLAMMGLAAVCAALTMLPWWIRNWLLLHRFVPLTAAAGYSLWVGSTPLGDGTWIQPPIQFRRGDEFQMSAALAVEAKRIIAADPVGYFFHCVAKFFRAMVNETRGVSQIYWARPNGHALLARIWVGTASVAQIVVLSTALVAAVIRRKRLLSQFLFAALAQILIFGIWFEFDQRHRYFLTPLLLLVAVSGVLAFRRSRELNPGDLSCLPSTA